MLGEEPPPHCKIFSRTGIAAAEIEVCHQTSQRLADGIAELPTPPEAEGRRARRVCTERNRGGSLPANFGRFHRRRRWSERSGARCPAPV
eukprot:COSAG01_NODE_40806_length_457_cov_1.455556_1_plen_89_part_10